MLSFLLKFFLKFVAKCVFFLPQSWSSWHRQFSLVHCAFNVCRDWTEMLSVWCYNSYLKNHNLTELKLIKPVISFPFFLRLTLFLQNKFSHVTESALEPLVHLCSGLLFLLPSQEMSTGRKQRMGEGWDDGFWYQGNETRRNSDSNGAL